MPRRNSEDGCFIVVLLIICVILGAIYIVASHPELVR